MKKFEYLHIRTNDDNLRNNEHRELQQLLDELTEKYWEIISLHQKQASYGPFYYSIVCKREVKKD